MLLNVGMVDISFVSTCCHLGKKNQITWHNTLPRTTMDQPQSDVSDLASMIDYFTGVLRLGALSTKND